jgi:2-C-methyl-D-erythritol 4-phosphate cytidylyltransferase
MKTYAIILAAGSGLRMNSPEPKQLMKLSGSSVLNHTLQAFISNEGIQGILLVCPMGEKAMYDTLFSDCGTSGKDFLVVEGGANRNLSTLSGLQAITDAEANVLIHDGVRPLVSQRIIAECIEALRHWQAVDTTVQAVDTIVKVSDDRITEVPDRVHLNRGQTPQAFRASTLRVAYDLWVEDGMPDSTDDCGIVLKYLPETVIHKVEGDHDNIKITTQLDMYIAEKLFQLKTELLPIKSEHLENGSGQVAVVFGGHTGIGFEICRELEKLHFEVIAASLNKDGIDVRDFNAVQQKLEESRSFGQISLVVNCAATLRMGKFEDRDTQDFINDFSVNFFGSAIVAKASLPFLKESKGQLILFASSSYTRGRAGYSSYSSSKAALVNLSQALADEWLDYGIKVNCINPDRTQTPLREKAFGTEPEDTLLSASKVAKSVTSLIGTSHTGLVFDVRRG